MQKTEPVKVHPFGLRTIMELFDIGPGAAIAGIATLLTLILAAVGYFIYSAPPTKIVISSGPEGSIFHINAKKYADILEKNGVKVKVLTSQGSLENVQRLSDPKARVDVGFVQGGIKDPSDGKLVSLGSVSYQPLLVFYRGKRRELLSDFAGQKIAIGPKGSGVRKFADQLLEANGIKEGGSTALLDWEGEQAAEGLRKGKIDAAFVMNESASREILRALLREKDIRLFSFKQANAYSRKIEFLNVLELPEGSIELGLDIPPQDVFLLGPMVELVAVKTLHPALSDLLLEAATQVHNRAGIFQKRGDFPTPLEHAIPISDDALRYYKSGKSLFYRYLPFWLASLLSRIIMVVIPMVVIMVPALKSIPALFRWNIQTKIHRRYSELLALEKEILSEKDSNRQKELRRHFDHIETVVNRMKVPASFADQFYGLRGHIDYVRGLVDKRS